MIVQVLDQSHNTMNKWVRRTNQTTGKTFPKSYFKPTKIIKLWNHTCRFSRLLKYFLFYLISWLKFFKILIVQVLDQLMMAREINVSYSFRLGSMDALKRCCTISNKYLIQICQLAEIWQDTNQMSTHEWKKMTHIALLCHICDPIEICI